MNILYAMLREALAILEHANSAAPMITLRVYRNDTNTETPCELIHHGTHQGVDCWEIAGVQLRYGYDEIRGLETIPRATSVTFNVVDP
jgi:hypothetical protein